MRLKKISKEFEKYLAEISVGVISFADLDNLISLYESEINNYYFTSSSEANLMRIIQGMYDKVSFIRECISHPHYLELMISIAANSNYLTDILVINPEYFYWIVNPSVLKTKLDRTKFKNELKSLVASYNSLTAKVHALKSIKRKELLRIGVRDIYRNISIKEIMEELSILAVQLAGDLFALCYQEVLNKYKLANHSGKYCLVTLGKLGGAELNYSSDIDLILFYDKERKINRQKYFSEILIETTHLFLKSSAEINGGFLYRIDFRLRPDGRNSSLCRSLQEYLDYYESRGEDWERQMLIKAGFLTGNKSLYNKFINYLFPFIFPSSFIISPKKQIVKMKENIERQNKDDENIKLSYGGIRDIEFSVQALQLLNGGRVENIRNSNTLAAIAALNHADLLTNIEAEILSDAYIFYRQIEHYLQLMNNRQTHLIPSDGELLEKMTIHLGFKNTREFNTRITETRNEIRKIYNSILIEEDDHNSHGYTLEEISFEDKKKARREYHFLKEGKGLLGNRTFDSKSIKGFEQIEKLLLNYLSNSIFPDKILSNLVRIIKQSDIPSIWFNELRDETFFKLLMEVCEYSQYSVDLFAEDKTLSEFFLNRKVFLKLSPGELADYEIKYTLFYLSVQLTVDLLDTREISNILSAVIQLKIKKITDEYSKKYQWNNNYFVAALGSLGASTISFYSDLDLLFIINNSMNYERIEKHFQDVLALLRQNLKPFTVDCRLRPEGESSQLVWDIEESKKYFEKRARVWELQALTKISYISGSKLLFNSFTKTASSYVLRFSQKQIMYELKEMHKKLTESLTTSPVSIFNIKNNRGGLIDIEFIIQSTILGNSKLFNQAIGKSFRDQIEPSAAKKLQMTEQNELLLSFDFLKHIQLLNQTIFNTTSSKLFIDDLKLRSLVNRMKYKSSGEFRDALNLHTGNVRKIFSKIFN